VQLINPSGKYRLFQLASTEQQLLDLTEQSGVRMVDVFFVLLDRTRFLQWILPCQESGNAIAYLELLYDDTVARECRHQKKEGEGVDILDPGHIYRLKSATGAMHDITFVKSSSGAVKYEQEWPGIQSQELIRALIDRVETLYCENSSLDDLSWVETTVCFLEQTLFMYEVRAWRRKQAEVNKKSPPHPEGDHPRERRLRSFPDVPFDYEGIEFLPIGDDGHVIVK
jgi:hypothetical protein